MEGDQFPEEYFGIVEVTTVPYGYCRCGCANKTLICKHTSVKRGLVRGGPMHYLRGHRKRNQILLKCENCQINFYTWRYLKRKKLFCSAKCMYSSHIFREKISTSQKANYQNNPERAKKISEGRMGEKHWNFKKPTTPEIKAKISKSLKGRNTWSRGATLTIETRKKISVAMTGENNWNWKGGYKNRLFHSRMREARKRGSEGTHTLAEWEALKLKYEYMCLCCKKFEPEIKLTEDHIMPISLGGCNYISNIQPLCRSCNSRKNAKYIDYGKRELLSN